MTKRIIGLDPGLSGGLALLSPDGLLVERMPIVGASGSKKRIDIAAFMALLKAWEPDTVWIEEPMAVARQSSLSHLTTGRNWGLLVGIIMAKEYRLNTVRPNVWKTTLRCPSDKVMARARATEIFPAHSHCWAKKCEDGCAEAALIAYYGSLVP
jgi:crossover junction endodeoxyribonuclease RuvC